MSKKQLLASVMVIGAFFIFSHMGENTSSENRMLPSVNYFGVLKDTSENTYNIEFITIDHLYKQIPVYEIPKHEQTDPRINTTLLDLSEINIITVNDPEKIVSFNNRSYVVITITFNGQSHTKHDYLIEKNKELFCSQKDSGAGDIEKKLSFQAIVSLEIKGRQKSDDDTKKS